MISAAHMVLYTKDPEADRVFFGVPSDGIR
jgi:hypothetical protein